MTSGPWSPRAGGIRTRPRRARLPWPLAGSIAVLGIGSCTPDRPPPAGDDATPETVGAAARSSFGADAAQAAPLVLFDEVADPVLERRLTLHLLARESGGRAEFSRALRDLLPRRATRDSTLVAIRAIIYNAPAPPSSNEGRLVPVAWGEWIPLEGWHGEVGAGRGTGHRVYSYHGAPPEW